MLLDIKVYKEDNEYAGLEIFDNDKRLFSSYSLDDRTITIILDLLNSINQCNFELIER